jgi:hypothetical protein
VWQVFHSQHDGSVTQRLPNRLADHCWDGSLASTPFHSQRLVPSVVAPDAGCLGCITPFIGLRSHLERLVSGFGGLPSLVGQPFQQGAVAHPQLLARARSEHFGSTNVDPDG